MSLPTLSERAHVPSEWILSPTLWWTLAITFYGVGDVSVSLYGISQGATELNVFYHSIMSVLPVVGIEAVAFTLLSIKLVTLAFFYGLYRVTPRGHRLGVPVALALLGAVVLAWNVRVVLSLG